MPYVGETKQLTLRASLDFIEELEKTAESLGGKTHNKLALLLVKEALALLQNPDQCPPLSPEFIRLRTKLHDRPSGSYADEPGRPSTGPTVVGNMQANDAAMKLLDSQSSHIARLEAECRRKDAEIQRLHFELYPHEKKLNEGNGGAA